VQKERQKELVKIQEKQEKVAERAERESSKDLKGCQKGDREIKASKGTCGF